MSKITDETLSATVDALSAALPPSIYTYAQDNRVRGCGYVMALIHISFELGIDANGAWFNACKLTHSNVSRLVNDGEYEPRVSRVLRESLSLPKAISSLILEVQSFFAAHPRTAIDSVATLANRGGVQIGDSFWRAVMRNYQKCALALVEAPYVAVALCIPGGAVTFVRTTNTDPLPSELTRTAITYEPPQFGPEEDDMGNRWISHTHDMERWLVKLAKQLGSLPEFVVAAPAVVKLAAPGRIQMSISREEASRKLMAAGEIVGRLMKDYDDVLLFAKRTRAYTQDVRGVFGADIMSRQYSIAGAIMDELASRGASVDEIRIVADGFAEMWLSSKPDSDFSPFNAGVYKAQRPVVDAA